MDSRSNRYYTENNINSPPTRSSRNKRLYKEVYGKYNDLENLPLEDNTDEIDMAKLKELVLSEQKSKSNTIKENLNILEQRKRNIDEQKVYDINKILEKAKYENDKLKETTQSIPKVNKQILNTLQSTELSLEELKKASKNYQSYQNDEKIVNLNTKEENKIFTNNLHDGWIITSFQRNEQGIYVGKINSSNSQAGKTIFLNFETNKIQETDSSALYGRTPFISNKMLFHLLEKWSIYNVNDNKFYNVQIYG